MPDVEVELCSLHNIAPAENGISHIQSCSMQKNKTKNDAKKSITHIVSQKFNNGRFLESIHAPQSEKTAFAHWDGKSFKIVSEYQNRPGHFLVPVSAKNNLIRHGVIKLPSYADEYDNVSSLIDEIKTYIHRYVDLEPEFETVAAHYVLLTWVYDRFRETPYLRIVGDYGTGKTRFLQAVGSICYKPIFASGASTISPIFHSLDSFAGTLILDEADFRFSDAKAEITKILNNGNVAGFPVLRCEAVKDGHYDPKAFNVFGPKIVATRGHYSDPALESRFIYERARAGSVRKDIPANLPDHFDLESQNLRNKLLMYRFQNWHKIELPIAIGGAGRIAQIFRPLLAVVENSDDRTIIDRYAKRSQSFLATLSSHSSEEKIVGIIADLLNADIEKLSIKIITENYRRKYGSEHLSPVTPKWVGGIIRNKLHLHTIKRNGNYFIADDQKQRLEGLFERYDIHSKSPVAGPDCVRSKAQSEGHKQTGG